MSSTALAKSYMVSSFRSRILVQARTFRILLKGVIISYACAIFWNSRGGVSADLFVGAPGHRGRTGVRSPNHPRLEPTRVRADAQRFQPCEIDRGRPLHCRAARFRIDPRTVRTPVAHRCAGYPP